MADVLHSINDRLGGGKGEDFPPLSARWLCEIAEMADDVRRRDESDAEDIVRQLRRDDW